MRIQIIWENEMICLKCGREIGGEVKFCKFCGEPIVDNEKETDVELEKPLNNVKVKSKTTGKYKRLLVSIILLLILVGSIFTYIYISNSPLKKMEKALAENDIASTEIYFAEIENTKDKNTAVLEIEKYAEQLVEDYLNEAEGKDYLTVKENLSKLYAEILDDNEKKKEQLDLVEDINESRIHFKTAEKYEKEDKKVEAILEYQEVVGKDELYYEKAEESCHLLKAAVKEESLKETEKLKGKKN